MLTVRIGSARRGRDDQQCNTRRSIHAQNFDDTKSNKGKNYELETYPNQQCRSITKLFSHVPNVDSGGHPEDQEKQEDVRPDFGRSIAHDDSVIVMMLYGM
jgi:hypothetical protein